MPYGISAEYVMGAQAGVDRALARRSMLQQLQAEEQQQKDRQSKLQEETKRARTEATLLGMPKAEAEAASVGELRGFVEARKAAEKEKERRATEQQMERDLKAATAVGKRAAELSPAEAAYMMRQIGVEDPAAAAQAWDSLGLLQRGMVMDIRSEKVRSYLEKEEDNQRQAAKARQEQAQFEAGAAQRKATLEQTTAQTEATRENQRRSAEEEERRRKDIEQYGDGPILKNEKGRMFIREAGKLNWRPVTEEDFISMRARMGFEGGTQERADAMAGVEAAGAGRGMTEPPAGVARSFASEAEARAAEGELKKGERIAVWDEAQKKWRTMINR